MDVSFVSCGWFMGGILKERKHFFVDNFSHSLALSKKNTMQFQRLKQAESLNTIHEDAFVGFFMKYHMNCTLYNSIQFKHKSPGLCKGDFIIDNEKDQRKRGKYYSRRLALIFFYDVGK